MTIKKKLEVFRAGTHTAMSGQSLIFTASNIRAIVDNYDPKVHEAPIVVGHPQTDLPAYGWVSALALNANGVIEATPNEVEPQFASLVNAGRFKKISSSLFPPGHPAHPLKGKPGGDEFYLKHVGFLGAAAPAVTGLKQASFAGNEGCLEVEFAASDLPDFGDSPEVGGFLSWLAKSFASFVTNGGQLPANTKPAAPPAPKHEDEIDMATAEEIKAQELALAKREKDIADREAAFAAQEKTRKEGEAKARLDDATEFCAGLVKTGQLKPADTPKLAGALAVIASLDPVSYSNGDGTTATASPSSVIRAALGALGKVTNFSEQSGGGKEDPPRPKRGAATGPDGVQFAADELDLDAKAQAYAAQHNVDYFTAVQRVQAQTSAA
jgi:hypothetical protein